MSTTYDDDDDRLACPHGCGHHMKDLWDYDWSGRDELQVECSSCSGVVILQRRAKVSYAATAVEDR